MPRGLSAPSEGELAGGAPYCNASPLVPLRPQGRLTRRRPLRCFYSAGDACCSAVDLQPSDFVMPAVSEARRPRGFIPQGLNAAVTW
jgi:hypothetical protein